MADFSLDPIFEGLKPIFAKLKAVAASALLVTPVALSVPVYAAENKPVLIHGIYKADLSNNAKQAQAELEQFADGFIELVDTIIPFIDLAASVIAPQTSHIISDDDVAILNKKINEYHKQMQLFIVNLQQCGLLHEPLIIKMKTFGEKMAHFSNVVKSEKYKQQADQVLLSRIYQGSHSVGYAFNPEHSFADFKKALRG